jgi:hypothetical protein
LINISLCYQTDPKERAMGWMMTPDGLNKQDYLEDMKKYRQEVTDYKRDKLKLYALTMKYT